MSRRRLFAISLATACAIAAVPTHDVSACGGFAGIGNRPPPFLAEEFVLIDHDGATEQFVREVRFSGADDHFGFVVPTPTQPTVAKVDKSPFPALKRAFPYVAPREFVRSAHAGPEAWPDEGGWGIGLGSIAGFGHGAGFGSGAGPGLGGGGVKVLSEQKVGAFTAFVLQADDATALDKWLAANQLKMSAGASTWTARYVARKFFFTAFRYEKPAGGKGELISETVRLTFQTPVAYYPYEEPSDPVEKRKRRILSVWSIGKSPTAPVAGHGDKEEVVWKRPWREGLRESSNGAALTAAIGAPHDDAWVQVFVDDKRSRVGWGDVLLVPAEPVVLDDAAKSARAKLVSLLLPEAP